MEDLEWKDGTGCLFIFYITIHCVDFYMYNIIYIYMLVCCFRFFVLVFFELGYAYAVRILLLGFVLVSGCVFVCAC